MEDKFDDIVKEITKEKAIEHLKRAFAEWGVEGTEDKIKELYANTPAIRDYLLEMYYKLLKGEL